MRCDTTLTTERDAANDRIRALTTEVEQLTARPALQHKELLRRLRFRGLQGVPDIFYTDRTAREVLTLLDEALQNQEDQLELVLRLGQVYDNGVLAVAELGLHEPATFGSEARVPDVPIDAASRHRRIG